MNTTLPRPWEPTKKEWRRRWPHSVMKAEFKGPATTRTCNDADLQRRGPATTRTCNDADLQRRGTSTAPSWAWSCRLDPSLAEASGRTGTAARPRTSSQRSGWTSRAPCPTGRSGTRSGPRRPPRWSLTWWTTSISCETRDACAEVNLLMAGASGLPLAEAVAEAVGVPVVPAHLQPVGAPTTAFPGIYLPHVPRWLGGPGRWVSGAATDLLVGADPSGRRPRPSGRPRARAAPTPVARARRPGPLRLQPARAPTAVVVVGPPPRDRLLDGAAATRVVTSASVRGLPGGRSCAGRHWLRQHDDARSGSTGRLLVDAVRRVGARAVLLGGWGALPIAEASDGTSPRRCRPWTASRLPSASSTSSEEQQRRPDRLLGRPSRASHRQHCRQSAAPAPVG